MAANGNRRAKSLGWKNLVDDNRFRISSGGGGLQQRLRARPEIIKLRRLLRVAARGADFPVMGRLEEMCGHFIKRQVLTNVLDFHSNLARRADGEQADVFGVAEIYAQRAQC